MIVAKEGTPATMFHHKHCARRAILAIVLFVAMPGLAVTWQEQGNWTPQYPADPLPMERLWHALAEVGDSHVVLFGGVNTHNGSDFYTVPAETWVYDADLNTWTDMSPEQAPSARWYHAMAAIGNGKAILFGGLDDTEEANQETWVYDFGENTWTLMSPPVSPSARAAHAMAQIGEDSVLLFGGADEDNTFNDTWIYDLGENTWTQLQEAVSPDLDGEDPPMPAPQYYHAMARFGTDSVLLFCGDQHPDWDHQELTWVYDRGDGQWYRLDDEPSWPSPRMMHALAGIGLHSALLYSGLGGPPGGDTWSFTLSDAWTEHEPLLYPNERFGHDMATLSGHRVLLFGGASEGPLIWDDTWIYQAGTVPELVVQPTSGLITSENGAQASFTIRATTPPESDITIPVESSNPGEGTVPASIVVPAQSTDPVTVFVTGVADAVADGDIPYTIITGDPSGGGDAYDGMDRDDVPDVSLTNLDTDVPRMEVLGNDKLIPDGSTSPNYDDGTRFRSTPVGSRVSMTFVVRNIGEVDLQLTGSPRVALDGSADFVVTQQPDVTILAPGASTAFTIQCRPSQDASSRATVSILSTDGTSSPYTFAIRCSGTKDPEINVRGNGRTIPHNDVTPSTGDGTEFVSSEGRPVSRTFTIENTGIGDLYLGGASSVSIDHADFVVSRQPNERVVPGHAVTFDVIYHPSGIDAVDATLHIENSDDDEDPYTFQIRGVPFRSTGPQANAGPDRAVGVGQRVTLDGSLSRAQSELTYEWAFAVRTSTSGSSNLLIPDGSACATSCRNFGRKTASFVPDVEGEYTLSLTVTDDQGRTSTDEVTLTAVKYPGSPFVIDEILCIPNPFSQSMRIRYDGVGTAETLHVSIHDLSGHLMWEDTARNVTSLSWDGRSADGDRLANGAYICVTVITGNGLVYTDRRVVFLRR